jgi:hypothetical protein
MPHTTGYLVRSTNGTLGVTPPIDPAVINFTFDFTVGPQVPLNVLSEQTALELYMRVSCSSSLGGLVDIGAATE